MFDTKIKSLFRTKLIISLLEVVLGLLQQLHPVLHLQINVLENGPKLIPIPKNIIVHTKKPETLEQESYRTAKKPRKARKPDQTAKELAM